MKEYPESWLKNKGASFLNRIGVNKGDTVLDFGCNEGQYTRPAARTVGNDGKVYAVDKNKEAINKLARLINKKGFSNVKCLHLTDNGKTTGEESTLDQNDKTVLVNIPLPDNSVDVALLYDVLHGGYFPESKQRIDLLLDIRRVLKPGGLLSLYPSHLKKFSLTYDQILGEVQKTGFQLEDKARRRLVHDGNHTRGWVFNFRVNEG